MIPWESSNYVLYLLNMLIERKNHSYYRGKQSIVKGKKVNFCPFFKAPLYILTQTSNKCWLFCLFYGSISNTVQSSTFQQDAVW